MADLVTSPIVDRSSTVALLVQVLIDGNRLASDDAQFASFHMAVAAALRRRDPAADVAGFYEEVMRATTMQVHRTIVERLLPAKLLTSTHLTSPEHLAEQHWRDALDFAKSLALRLWRGGLSVTRFGRSSSRN